MAKSFKFDPESIDQETREQVWDLIAVKIDAILDDFYEAAINSKHREILRQTDLEVLKNKQKSYWKYLFLRMDEDDYNSRIGLMHLKHKNNNIDIADYISSYLYLLTQFHQLALQEASGPKQAYDYISAVNTVVGADIDRALQTYNDVYMV